MERITESEQVILQILWETGPLTAVSVSEIVRRERDWSLSTVKTLLGRLVAKNAVVSKEDGRRFFYSAETSREEVAATQTRRLIDGLFGGRTAPLVAHLARRNALTHEDIREIKALLNELES